MSVVRARFLGALCICNLIGLLVVGLWPFGHPQNQARWLISSNGLRLGGHSTIVSVQTLQISPTSSFGSIEVWLQPKERDKGTILSFYDSHTGVSFSVRQEATDLVLEKHQRKPIEKDFSEKIYVDKLLKGSTAKFLTITSGPDRTAIYADGLLIGTVPNFSISGEELRRRLIVGDSAGQRDSWPGDLRGLAIYSRELTASEVFRHFAEWTRVGRPQVNDEQRSFDLYLLDEHRGNIARSSSSTNDALSIPDRYSILDKTLLEAPWNAYRSDLNYWYDVAINVGGFIPFGMLAAAFFAAAHLGRRTIFIAIIAGGIISLTIESLQWFLPTRDSDMTDLLTNTLGTCMGAGILRWTPAHSKLNGFLNFCESTASRFVCHRPTHDLEQDVLPIKTNDPSEPPPGNAPAESERKAGRVR